LLRQTFIWLSGVEFQDAEGQFGAGEQLPSGIRRFGADDFESLWLGSECNGREKQQD